MAKAIGIDLGTTNSVISIVKGVAPSIIIDTQSTSYENGQLMRSVVAKNEDEIIVGTDAYEYGLGATPENTIRSIKRLMGRDYSDPNVQRMKEKYPFRIVKPNQGTERSVAVELRGKQYSPQEISAMILGKIRKVAAESTQDEEISAVITVPAYFNDKQKDATRQAGWLAGLKVQRLLPEPTAAAISYGVDEVAPGETRTILVYDLGGGTFDVSILLIAGGAFVERGKGGDMWLGGDDFDEMIAEYVLRRTQEEYLIDDMDTLVNRMGKEETDKFKFKLAKECEEAKKRLSVLQKTRVRLPAILKDEDGNDILIDVEITRSTFDSMILGQIEKTIHIVKSTIAESSLTPDEIDKILLVGGSTLIPLVFQKLVQEFGKEKILRSNKPMLCVAEGAAILANRLGDKIECPGCAKEVGRETEKCPFCGFDMSKAKILNVEVVGNVGHTYSAKVLGLGGDEITTIIFAKADDPIPHEREEMLHTNVDGQRLVKVVWNDETTKGEVGKIYIPLLENLPRGTRVAIKMSIDESGISTMTARIPEHPQYNVTMHLTRGATDEVLYGEMDDVINKFGSERHKLKKAEESQFWTRAKDLVEAINSGKFSSANSIVLSLKSLLGQHIQESAWERDAENYIGFAEYLLNTYIGIITADQSYEYKKLIERLKEEVVRRNTEGCQVLCHEMEEFEKTLDQVIFTIHTIFRASWQIAKVNPPRAIQLEQEARLILADYKGSRFDTSKGRLDKIWPEVNRILESRTGVDSEIMLRKGD